MKNTLALIISLLALSAFALPCAAYDADQGLKQAAALLNQGRLLESMAAYDEVSRLASFGEVKARALLLMGGVESLYLEDFEGALERYGRVVQDFPHTSAAPEARFNQGMVLYETGQYARAARAFEDYLSKWPQGRRAMTAGVWLDMARQEALAPAKAPAPKVQTPPPTRLRVLLVDKQPRAEVFAKNLKIPDPFSGRVLFSGSRAAFTAQSGQLFVNGRPLGVDRVLVEPGPKDALSINNKRYRGVMTVQASQDKVSVLNLVDSEQYLYSVVAREMSPSWPAEALKAQAVAARSYALFTAQKRKNQAYDLLATTSSQVYGGLDAEAPSTIRAVDATRGQVLLYKGNLAITYFHANSGGFTEDAGQVWVADLPYLKAVKDPWSLKAPSTHWTHRVSKSQAGRLLGRSGLAQGPVEAIKPLAQTSSGRVARVAVESQNKKITLKSNSFRIKMGAGNIKSTLFDIQTDSNGFLLTGKGFGHGVGMSQWGAYYMAKSGRGFDEILSHYYINTKLGRLGN